MVDCIIGAPLQVVFLVLIKSGSILSCVCTLSKSFLYTLNSLDNLTFHHWQHSTELFQIWLQQACQIFDQSSVQLSSYYIKNFKILPSEIICVQIPHSIFFQVLFPHSPTPPPLLFPVLYFSFHLLLPSFYCIHLFFKFSSYSFDSGLKYRNACMPIYYKGQ